MWSAAISQATASQMPLQVPPPALFVGRTIGLSIQGSTNSHLNGMVSTGPISAGPSAFNIGSVWNHEKQAFVAPSDGAYSLSAVCDFYFYGRTAPARYIALSFRVAGNVIFSSLSNVAATGENANADYTSITLTSLIELQAGTEVSLWVYSMAAVTMKSCW